jgi:molybdopterin-guanine dinucleotide biosynthesis protein A
MLQRAIDACTAAGCAPITVVGPPPLTPDHDASSPPRPAAPPLPRTVRWAREEPPFSGPAAAVVAALATWETLPEWSFLLACDLPRVDAAVIQLREDMLLLPSDTDGVCLADASSRPQWLTGLYRTRALVQAAAALPDSGRNASVRALLDDLAIAVVRAPADITADVDTWEDFDRARAHASEDEGNRDD